MFFRSVPSGEDRGAGPGSPRQAGTGSPSKLAPLEKSSRSTSHGIGGGAASGFGLGNNSRGGGLGWEEEGEALLEAGLPVASVGSPQRSPSATMRFGEFLYF
jgi:hypothetical protein